MNAKKRNDLYAHLETGCCCAEAHNGRAAKSDEFIISLQFEIAHSSATATHLLCVRVRVVMLDWPNTDRAES